MTISYVQIVDAVLKALLRSIMRGSKQSFSVNKFEDQYKMASHDLYLQEKFKEVTGATKAIFQDYDSEAIQIKIIFENGFISNLLLMDSVSLTLIYDLNSETCSRNLVIWSHLKEFNLEWIHIPLSDNKLLDITNKHNFRIIFDLIRSGYLTNIPQLKKYLAATAKMTHLELEAAMVVCKLANSIEPFAKEIKLSK